MRVSEGGHNIPEEIIRRRYYRGMYNLTNRFAHICDYWIIIDNSSQPFTFVAEGQEAIELKIYDALSWQKIKDHSDKKD